MKSGAIALWVGVTAYLLLLVVGAGVFHMEASMPRGNQMNVPRSIFTSVNAITLTGFQQGIPINDYQMPGRVMLLALTIAGTLFALILGAMAIVRILNLSYSIADIILAAITIQILVILVGAVAPLDEASLFNSIFQTASAFGNSGLYLGILPSIKAWQTHVVLLPLAVLGGLGLPVLMELFGKGKLSDYSCRVIRLTAGFYLGSVLVLWALQLDGSKLLISGQSPADLCRYIGQTIVSSSVEAINTRSAGFSWQSIDAWPRTVQWVVLILMMIGASPGGTAGGIKTTTLYEIFCNGDRLLLGQVLSRTFGIALLWVGIFLLMVATGMMLLLIGAPEVPGDRLLFLAVSAVSNTGLSHDPITLSWSGLWPLSLLMFAGKIVPLIILWWMADNIKDSPLPIA